MSRPRVAFVAIRDARDVRSWSGTLNFSKRAIEQHVGDVIDLTPAPVPHLPLRALRLGVRLLSGKSFSYEHDLLFARWLGAVYTRRIAEAKPNLIFAAAGSAIVPFLETAVPIVYFSDATFRMMSDYHEAFSRLVKRTEHSGNEIEQRSIEKAAISCFTSSTALESARKDYKANHATSHVIPLGANLPSAPSASDAAPRQISSPLRLLFVGVQWAGKGGDIALDALRTLEARGIDATLTVVGCTPPSGVSHPKLRIIPFLNKSDPQDAAKLYELYKSAHLFILPTRFEAAGIVFAEAAAFGLPSLGTRTGGVPTYLRENESGVLLAPEATGAQWADAIEALIQDPAKYQRLALGARALYERELNWDAFGRKLAALTEPLL